MADSKISALPSSTTPLAGTEVLPIVQSGTTKQVSVANLTSGRSVAASSFKVGGSGTGAIYSPTPINCGSGIFAIGAGSNSANGRGPGAGYSADSDGNINVYRAFWWQLGASDQAHLMLGNSTATAFNNPLTVTTDTNITFNTGNLIQGTAAKGINFTANTPAAGMTSQLLNWYEEGTWTPVVADASTGGNTGTCTVNNATYTRIGRVVTIQALITGITTTGMTAGNALFVRGLPYAAANYAQGNFYSYRISRDAATVSSSVSVSAGTFLNFRLYTTNSATTDLYVLVSDIVSGTSELAFTLTYSV